MLYYGIRGTYFPARATDDATISYKIGHSILLVFEMFPEGSRIFPPESHYFPGRNVLKVLNNERQQVIVYETEHLPRGQLHKMS